MSKESAKSCRRLEERGGQLLGLLAAWALACLLEIFSGVGRFSGRSAFQVGAFPLEKKAARRL